MAFVEQLQNTKAPAKSAEQAPPAEAPAGQPPAEVPAEEAAQTPEGETPATPEGDTPPETPEGETPAEEAPKGEAPAATDDDDDGDLGDELTPLTAKNIKVKPRDDDQVFRLQLRIMKRNRDLTGEEALARAKKELGLDKPEVPAVPARKPDGLPDTVEEIQAKIAELKAQRKTAATNLELEVYEKLNDQIEALTDKRGLLVEQGREQARQALATYNRGFAESQDKAESLYAFASDPESPGGKLMIEIDAALEANGDPLFNHPNKPLKLAQMAATRLNIPPKTKTPAATAKAAAPGPKVPAAQVPPKKDVIPTGASRTTPQTTATKKPLDLAIETAGVKGDAKTLDDILSKIGVYQ